MIGYVALHRKILDNPIYRKPAWLSVWITLLLLATHKEKEDLIWNGKPIKLKKGQFITGRKKLSELTGVAETTVERVLEYLEETGHQIGQQKTTKYRLITILNWDKYQKTDIKLDNRRTTDGQQTDTINNGNKGNNENKEIAAKAAPSMFNSKEYINQLISDKQRHINIIGLYFQFKGFEFPAKEAAQYSLKRELRPAMGLKGYSDGKILETMQYVAKQVANGKFEKWDLGTITKYINEL